MNDTIEIFWKGDLQEYKSVFTKWKIKQPQRVCYSRAE